MKKFVLILLCAISSWQLQAQNDELITASLKGDFAKVKSLVESGANVKYVDPNGNTPLGVAYFSPEIAEYLLSKGADPNGGSAPVLVSASRYYSVDVMKMALKAGADPNKPLVVKVDASAAIRKLLEDEKAKGKKANKGMVKAYEDMIAKMPAGNTTSYSALQWAVGNTNCRECIELLLNAGAKTDFKNNLTGGNIVHELESTWIPNSQRAANIQTNIPYFEKAGMGIPDWYKNLDVSKYGDMDDILTLLINKGADIEFVDNNGRTPLKDAILQPTPKEDVVMALVNHGANVKKLGMTLEDTEFTKETSTVDKVKTRYDFPREGRNSGGGGYSANMDLLKTKPKRVALISYYLYDPGKGKTKTSSTSTMTTTSVSVWRTPNEIGQAQVNGFYSKSIDALKGTFKENGIDLLTPDEFLDTDEKAEFYYGFDQESAKKEKTSIKRGAVGGIFQVAVADASTLKVSPSGKGYRSFFIANEGEDESMLANFQGGVFSANRKMSSSLGYDLAKGLGVDAVIVVYVCTRKIKIDKEDYGVNSVVTMMLGPNPGKSEETDAEAKNLGQFYCGTRTYYGTPVLFKESKGVFGQYDGMANVMKSHVEKMCRYVNGKEKDTE